MKEYIEISRRGKMENIVLKFVIILFCLLTTILNSKLYMCIFKGTNIINDRNSLLVLSNSNERFVTLDLTNAKLMKYQIISNEDDKINIYSLNIEGEDILVVLTENTALTNKVTLRQLDFDSNMKDIKEKLEYNTNNKYFSNKYYSNINYMTDKKVISFKFYITIILLLLCGLTMPIDIYFYLKPEKTRCFKKLVREM